MHSVFENRRYLIPFRATLLPQIFTDVLVIGGGVAGMRAALAAAEHGEVIIAGKGGLKDSNTFWAQGGIAAAVDQADSNAGNNSGSVDITVQAVDLSVTKSVDDATPNEGATLTYTVIAANAGPDGATNVQLTDLLPAGVTYVSDTTTQGTYNSGTGVWDVGSVTTAVPCSGRSPRSFSSSRSRWTRGAVSASVTRATERI